MGKQRMIGRCLVLQEALALAWDRYRVVLCEMPVSPEATEETDTYVVWYIDPNGKPSRARYFKALAAAQAEFARRT